VGVIRVTEGGFAGLGVTFAHGAAGESFLPSCGSSVDLGKIYPWQGIETALPVTTSPLFPFSE